METNDTTIAGPLDFNAHGTQPMAKPLDLQRLESSLNIEPFMTYAQEIVSQPLSSSDDSDSELNANAYGSNAKLMNGDVANGCGKYLACAPWEASRKKEGGGNQALLLA